MEKIGLTKDLIGVLGIVASFLVGFYTGIKIVKSNLKIPPIGAPFAILFEVIIGGCLVYYSII